jgi:hypothetical protein
MHRTNKAKKTRVTPTVALAPLQRLQWRLLRIRIRRTVDSAQGIRERIVRKMLRIRVPISKQARGEYNGG